MLALRSLAFNVISFVFFVGIGVLGIPLLVTRGGALTVAKLWARGTVFLTETVAGIRVEIRGRENIPAGGCIVAAKHQSALDTFALVPALDDFAIILKRELNWVPVFGWYTARSGMIPVNRGGRSAALRGIAIAARQVIADGRQVIIYPEGTRRAPDAPPAYKFGVTHLYVETGATCVPVAVNTGVFWPRRSFWRLPGHAVIEFLPPIPPGLDSKAFHARLQEAIETATDRLVAEGRASLRHPERQGRPRV